MSDIDPVSKLTATLARTDGGEPMPLAVLGVTSRLARLLATLARAESGIDEAYGVTIRSVRCKLWAPWNLHDPPAVPPGAVPPASRSKWVVGGEHVEALYTFRVDDIVGLCDWPPGCGEALAASGLAPSDVVVVYRNDDDSDDSLEPQAWMPLGRWCERAVPAAEVGDE